jgi:antibiotic biosynthesis monooxygenase (ABM) superfamily enzyme
VARHYVAPGDEDEFGDWVDAVDRASREFAGYQGMEVIRSHGSPNSNEFCVFRFDSAENLATWMLSGIRQKLLDDRRSCYRNTSKVKSYRSIGFWFDVPDASGKTPSNHKMAAVTLLVIWPMVHFIGPPISTIIPVPLLAEFVTVALIVVLMTYAVMPIVIRILAG